MISSIKQIREAINALLPMLNHAERVILLSDILQKEMRDTDVRDIVDQFKMKPDRILLSLSKAFKEMAQ